METIRLCTHDDVTAVRALSEQWAAENITYGVVPTPEEMLVTALGSYFWVAESEDMAIGYAIGRVAKSDGLAVIAAGERYLEIDEIYVSPGYREKGTGGRLLRRLLEAAAADGIERFLVSSASKDWERTMRFYEQAGFRMWTFTMTK